MQEPPGKNLPKSDSAAGESAAKEPPLRDTHPSTDSSNTQERKEGAKTDSKGKKQPSLEKIAEILAKAEAMPNPTPEIRGMIEKLKAHKRQLELKRTAEPDTLPQKRQAVGHS